jgi:hypothetical protein
MDLAVPATANWVDAPLDDGFWLGPAILRLPAGDPAPRRSARTDGPAAANRPRRPRPLRAVRIPA